MRKFTTAGCLIFVIFTIVCLIGWVNHLIVCFTEGQWGFLIAGAIAAPIGIIHGWGRLFGFW